MKSPALFLLLFILTSCASMQSGRYIQWHKNDNIEKIASRYKIPPAAILNSNRGKRFRPGEWVFIPENIGIFSSNDYRLLYRGSISSADFYRGKYLWPVPSSKRISSPYGKIRGPRRHKGLDIAAQKGSVILAAEDGTVTYAGNKLRGYGNLVIIHHKDGYSTLYAHADKLLTRRNKKVYRGQIIALIGSTGRSTAPHLHFEVRRGKKTYDPHPLLKSRK